jgi:hypothetical protein
MEAEEEVCVVGRNTHVGAKRYRNSAHSDDLLTAPNNIA